MGRNSKTIHASVAAAAGAICIGIGSQAKAAAPVTVPLINPGFDSLVTATGGAFHYEGNAYTTGDFIPNHTFLTGMPAVPFDAFIADSHTGSQILNDLHNAEATGSVNDPTVQPGSGYVGVPAAAAGTFYDDRDFNPG